MKKRVSNNRSKKVTKRVHSPVANRQLVIPLGNGWVVKGESAKTFTVITDNKREAVTIATTIAKTNKSGIVIHGKDGKIQETKSYAS